MDIDINITLPLGSLRGWDRKFVGGAHGEPERPDLLIDRGDLFEQRHHRGVLPVRRENWRFARSIRSCWLSDLSAVGIAPAA